MSVLPMELDASEVKLLLVSELAQLKLFILKILLSVER